ncbi:MAG: hypothetical protein SFT68_03270 [Rickettsiaceae bacterium]|nr:hypothetical protein [Rickettsiaceae bacterium]
MAKYKFRAINQEQYFQALFRRLISRSEEYFRESTIDEIRCVITSGYITDKQLCSLFAHFAKISQKINNNIVSRFRLEKLAYEFLNCTDPKIEFLEISDLVNIMYAYLDLKSSPGALRFAKLKSCLHQNIHSANPSDLCNILRFFSCMNIDLDYEFESKLKGLLYEQLDNCQYSILANSLRSFGLLGLDLAPEFKQKYLDNIYNKIHLSPYKDLSSSLWAITKLDIHIGKNLAQKFHDEIYKKIQFFAPRQLCGLLYCFVKIDIDVSANFAKKLQAQFLKNIDLLSGRELIDIITSCAQLNISLEDKFTTALQASIYNKIDRFTLENFADIIWAIATKHLLDTESNFLSLSFLKDFSKECENAINNCFKCDITAEQARKLLVSDFIFSKISGNYLFDSAKCHIIEASHDQKPTCSNRLINILFEALKPIYGDKVIKSYLVKECVTTADIFFPEEKCVIQIAISENLNYNGHIFRTKLNNAIFKATGLKVIKINAEDLEQNSLVCLRDIESQLKNLREITTEVEEAIYLPDDSEDLDLSLDYFSEPLDSVKGEEDIYQTSLAASSENENNYLPEPQQTLDPTSNICFTQYTSAYYYMPYYVSNYDQYINYANINSYPDTSTLLSNIQYYNVYYHNLYLNNMIPYNDYVDYMNIYCTSINNYLGYNACNLLASESFDGNEARDAHDIS